MVKTRAKNQDAHPGAPLMTTAARIKAGITTTKRRTKKPTKDDQIRELQTRLAALEYPDDDAAAVSKEPLVSLSSLSVLSLETETLLFLSS